MISFPDSRLVDDTDLKDFILRNVYANLFMLGTSAETGGFAPRFTVNERGLQVQETHGELLRAWHNFYMLAGGASASLMGLVFVAASLGARFADADSVASSVRTFVSPIIIHLSAVLVIAMLVMIPIHTTASLGVYLALGGVAGLVYAGATGVHLWQHHRGRTRVKRADWVWRVLLPAISYLMISGAAVRLLLRASSLPEGLAIAVIVLLLLGIRNTWDLLLWITQHRLRAE